MRFIDSIKVEEWTKELGKRLFSIGDASMPANKMPPGLIWPIKDKRGNNKEILDDKIRISEQEARFFLSFILNETCWHFSVETPTILEYGFSGRGKRRASTDLTIYSETEEGLLERSLNVEFKAHNPSDDVISKEFEKLVKEPVRGWWVHVLKNIDSGTLPSVFGKIEKSLDKLSKDRNQIKNENIYFSIFIIEKK
ncbi:MAG TPA: hypothetical protein EYP36_10245, partial [Calditrichaeota bacterium]|nr:hypothetical protein [Calditrichota bacterium]